MTRDDVPLGKGQCDIRLQVDNEVEVALRGDTVFIHNIAGRGAYDDGNSECNAPLPNHPVQGFNFQVVDSRGDIRLLSEPSRRNDWSAIVRIRDSSGGQGRYHFRISWEMTGGDDFGRPGRGYEAPPPGRLGPGFPDERPNVPGFAWNNVIHFDGRGRGEAFSGGGAAMRLRDVNVDIDRGGRVLARFRTPGPGRELTLTGVIVGREGPRYKVDAMTEDRRIRGSMYLMLDREDVNAITFEGTNGRDRMRLNWDRR